MHPVFAEHNRSLENNRFIYPVISRRSAGLSLGINLDYNKLCNFDCPYCQVNRRELPKDIFSLKEMKSEILGILPLIYSREIFSHERFKNTPSQFQIFSDIAFAGDGEPSVNRNLLPAVQFLKEVSETFALPKIVLITNATGLQRKPTQEALHELQSLNGEVWAKLDAGTQEYFSIVSHSKFKLDQIENRIKTVPIGIGLKIQTCLMKISGVSPSSEELKRLQARIENIHQVHPLREVQIYTLARSPAQDYVSAIPASELIALTEPMRAAKLPVKIYPGAAD